MNRTTLIIVVTIFLIALALTIVGSIIQDEFSRNKCKDIGVLYIKSDEMTGQEISQAVDDVGIVVVSDKNRILARTQILEDCPQFFDEVYSQQQNSQLNQMIDSQQ